MYEYEESRDEGLIRYDYIYDFTCDMHVYSVVPNMMSLSSLIYKTLP